MSTVTAAAAYPINSGGFNSPAGQVAYGGTAYSGTFIPALWSGKLAQKFYAATVFGEIANTDWQGDITGMGDTVIINTIPTITINSYSVGQNLSYEVPAPSTIQLVINKGKYFGVNVNNVLELQAKPKLMDLFTNDASMQMKIQIDKDVLAGTFNQGDASNQGATAGAISGAYNLGTDTAPVTLTASNILQSITALSSVLDENNVPETDRWLVLTPTERQILMQSNLAQAQFMGDASSILRNGKIGVIDRFTVYVSNLTPRAAARHHRWPQVGDHVRLSDCQGREPAEPQRLRHPGARPERVRLPSRAGQRSGYPGRRRLMDGGFGPHPDCSTVGERYGRQRRSD
jgi:hypothetical protein